MMLMSLVKCMKQEGVEEIKWGEVSALSLCLTTNANCLLAMDRAQHLLYMNILTLNDDPPTEFQLVLELLVEDGMVVARRPECERKVLLNLKQSEIERVLSEVGGSRWKNVLST